MKLFKNAKVYAPNFLGIKDILVEGEKISKIADSITEYDNISDVEIFDLKGKTVVPGYVDIHVHITGGGGEKGPASRTPEASIGEIIECGVTTVLGVGGTDAISRSLENLVAKTRALNIEGITAYMLTGAYPYPSPTLTGDIERDIYLIDICLGTKIAASDHRSSNPTAEHLIEIGTKSRRGGMLAGCPGTVTVHMGSGKAKLSPILEAINNSDLPPKTFLPTHIDMRSPELFNEGIELAKLGGWIDITCGSNKEEIQDTIKNILHYIGEGAPLENLTVSTDAYGSIPVFDKRGVCIGSDYVRCAGLHLLTKELVLGKHLPLEKALNLITKNPASTLGLDGVKGEISVGAHADMVIYDEDFNVESVIAKGKFGIWEGKRYLKNLYEM